MKNSVLEKIISLINIIEPKNIVYGPKIKPDVLVLLNNLTNSTIKLLDPNDVSKGSIGFWWEGEEEEGGPLPVPPEWIGNAITIIDSLGDCDLMLLDANYYASMNKSLYNKVKYVILFDEAEIRGYLDQEQYTFSSLGDFSFGILKKEFSNIEDENISDLNQEDIKYYNQEDINLWNTVTKDMMSNEDINAARDLIKNAEAIIIAAGSGMGVDSGLPDFRGNEGFWEECPVIEDLGLSFNQMANPDWFKKNPTLAWAFYGHRLNLYRETIPHDGFNLLLNLVKRKDENYFIYTSNVDGQFQKAGFDENKIIECHGSIHHLQCLNNCAKLIWENNEKIKVDMVQFKSLNYPTCNKCGSVVRPNILMFNDWGWNYQREKEQDERYKQFLKLNQNKKLVIIEIGAGPTLPTIRLESEKLAKNLDNTYLIRINPKDYDLNGAKGISVSYDGLDGIEVLLENTL